MTKRPMAAAFDNLKYDAKGLIPAIVQDAQSKTVLMMGWMNRESIQKTIETGKVHFFSRSRNKLWQKGESSGHVLRVREIRVDCDADALLVRVEAVGPGVCHEGYRSCFFRAVEPGGDMRVIAERTYSPEEVYGSEKRQ